MYLPMLICSAVSTVMTSVEGFNLHRRQHSSVLASGMVYAPTESKLFSLGGGEEPEAPDERIDLSLDDRLYRIRLPRAPGIEWGTDLSFSFVYVRDLDPAGPASMSGRVEKGDQVCELIPVAPNEKPVNLLGASFDFVMGAFASLDKTVTDLDLVFFKGTKDELKAACTGGDASAGSDIITVTVIQNKGADDETTVKLKAQAGINIRQLLLDNGINVYQSLTRFTNCKGKQLCGTCIVNMKEGSENTNWKSMDEASTLRDNPDSYRLSCISFAYGDITVETFPPIEKYQWTR
jgi:ferredoxin